MENQLTGNDDFMGRAWVPSTLGVVAACVAILVAIDQAVMGFLAAATVVAMSITLRLTWDRRDRRGYRLVIVSFVVAHLTVITLLHEWFTRAAGGTYMGAALVDAFAMTLLIRVALNTDTIV